MFTVREITRKHSYIQLRSWAKWKKFVHETKYVIMEQKLNIFVDHTFQHH